MVLFHAKIHRPKVTDDNGNHTCIIDKTVKEIYTEIAVFVNQTIFHGKTWLVSKESITQKELFKELIPSIACILRDISSRSTKN
jgi:hypothetical protein